MYEFDKRKSLWFEVMDIIDIPESGEMGHDEDRAGDTDAGNSEGPRSQRIDNCSSGTSGSESICRKIDAERVQRSSSSVEKSEGHRQMTGGSREIVHLRLIDAS